MGIPNGQAQSYRESDPEVRSGHAVACPSGMAVQCGRRGSWHRNSYVGSGNGRVARLPGRPSAGGPLFNLMVLFWWAVWVIWAMATDSSLRTAGAESLACLKGQHESKGEGS